MYIMFACRGLVCVQCVCVRARVCVLAHVCVHVRKIVFLATLRMCKLCIRYVS